MAAKEIYIIRHGETRLNESKILQGGGVDESLNELGLKQSRSFYLNYKSFPFKKIYTSGLKRSIESVQSFIDDGIATESLKDLNEINYGIYDGVMVSEGAESPYPALIRRWQEGETHAKLEGGESPDDVKIRLNRAWEYIMSNWEETPVLISMHGRAMRILLAVISGTDIKLMHQFPHNNLGLYHISIAHPGELPVFMKENDVSHLK